MTKQEEILDWLSQAILMNTQEAEFRHYFDVLDKQFFSLPSKEYLLTQLKNVAGHLTKGPFYPWTETDILQDRLERIQKKDATIIAVPSLGAEDNKTLERLYESSRADGNDFWLKQKKGYLIYKAISFITGFNIDLDRVSAFNYNDGAGLAL